MVRRGPFKTFLKRLSSSASWKRRPRKRNGFAAHRAAPAEVLEPRLLLTGTAGVYDENVIATNTVDFVATGSSIDNTEFGEKIAIAHTRNYGGVIDARSLAFLGYEYGANENKTVLVTRAEGTNYGIGGGTSVPRSPISETGAFVSTRNTTSTDRFNYTSLDLDVDSYQADEKVVQLGVTVLSYSGRDYGNVTVTARLASGETVSATRAISEDNGAGDTFYGLSAPVGDYITGFSIAYDGAIDAQLWFDDIGFRTAIVGNHDPVANDDAYSGIADEPLQISGPGPLANDTDADGDAIFLLLQSRTQHGNVTVRPNGLIHYVPDAGFTGTDTFTYRAVDGNGGISNLATVTLTIEAANTAPEVDDATFTIDENSAAGTIVGDVAATDAEGDTLTYSIVAGNESGAFAIDSATGRITVVDPAPLDFETTPTFILTVQVADDGAGNLTGTGTITINLADVNEAPPVTIDIKPRDQTNTIRLGRNKTVAVAILSSAELNAPEQIDLNSLSFGRTGDEDSLVHRGRRRPRVRYKIKDVNGDGLLDLVVYFDVGKADFRPGDTEGILKGRLADGTEFEARQEIRVERRRGRHR